MASTTEETGQGSLADVAARASAEVAQLDRELAEIDMLIAQARVEAERHELKRTQAQEKIAELPEATPSQDVIALHAQQVTLTRRAGVMESQVEVLEGKRKALGRFRDSIAALAEELGAAVDRGDELGDGAAARAVGVPSGPEAAARAAESASSAPTAGMRNFRPQAGICGLCKMAWKVSHSDTKPFSGGSAEMATQPTRKVKAVSGMR